MTTKRGRGRSYIIDELDGFRNEDVARAAAYLDELRERVFDQIKDLPQDALDFEAGETKLSIGRLGLHLGWGELSWMKKLSAQTVQNTDDLSTALAPGSLKLFKEPPPKTEAAKGIVALCRRVRNEVTIPVLQGVEDFDESRVEDGSTVRGVITHLQWHWVYHSGHIGLISFEWGSDYEWTMAGPLVTRP
ncbi:MAG: hypothetical protein CL404_03220 [Acidimicrobiaceae bacterium]|nr:hypothetical protein [Acidimicrobiaceae bacterium]